MKWPGPLHSLQLDTEQNTHEAAPLDAEHVVSLFTRVGTWDRHRLRITLSDLDFDKNRLKIPGKSSVRRVKRSAESSRLVLQRE